MTEPRDEPLPAYEVCELSYRIAQVGVWDWSVQDDQRSRDALDALRSRVYPDDLARACAEVREALNGGDDYVSEFRIVRPDGTVRDLEAHGGVQRDAGGKPIRMIGVTFDVTERKRAEEATEREKALLNELMTTLPDNIYFKDRNSRFIKVNHAMARWVGLNDPNDAVGKTDVDFFGEEHAQQAFADEERVMATGHPLVGLEEKETWPDGRITWVSTSKLPMRDALGRIVGLVGLSRDITDRKELEEQVRQGQKMEAIGRLAGGVAHDFNNLLGVIIGSAEGLMKRLADNDPLHAKAAQLLKAAQRGADLTRQLLAFGRRQVLEPKAIDLNDVVSDMNDMLRRILGEDLELEALLDPELGSAWADPGQIGQIILNLVVNARDAMPSGGRLTIETKNVELDKTYTSSHRPTRPGRYVMLAVSDTGTGMSKETVTHLFEPFFTTKDVGKGTGLGLCAVYGIVKQSEGYVWVYSELGVGSTFKVYLPRVDDAVPSTTLEECPAPLPRGGETVLLVEDEPALRDVVRDTLEDYGYTVLSARGGAEALHLAHLHPGTIHLLVTDVTMPGMAGPEVAEKVMATRPQVKVLFVSGYTQEAIIRHGRFGLHTAFLSKPFTSMALLCQCRELLDEQEHQRDHEAAP